MLDELVLETRDGKLVGRLPMFGSPDPHLVKSILQKAIQNVAKEFQPLSHEPTDTVGVEQFEEAQDAEAEVYDYMEGGDNDEVAEDDASFNNGRTRDAHSEPNPNRSTFTDQIDDDGILSEAELDRLMERAQSPFTNRVANSCVPCADSQFIKVVLN